MFRADVRVLNDSWVNHGLSRCYCDSWRIRFGELGLETDGISVFFDEKGYFRIYGADGPDERSIIEECETEAYSRKEKEFRDKYSEPVLGWWESLERHSSVEDGILEIKYGNQRFRISEDAYRTVRSRMTVYRLFDEFYVEDGLPGLDEIVSSVLEEDLLRNGETEYFADREYTDCSQSDDTYLSSEPIW